MNADEIRQYISRLVILALFLLALLCLYQVRDILVPLVLALVATIIVSPLLTKMESKGVPRGISLLLLITGFGVVLSILLIAVIPVVVGEFTTFGTYVTGENGLLQRFTSGEIQFQNIP